MKHDLDIKLDLPDEFFEEETRCDHVISSEMKKVWAVQLDLLNELLSVCKKHDIKIYADGGTMLGAVRHQGYIPWDDDVDMVMLREDYDKLCKIADKEFSHPYFFQTWYNDPSAMRAHAQLRNSNTTAILEYEYQKGYDFNQGIFIDIFQLDSIPDDAAEIDKFSRKLKKAKSKYKRYARCTNRYVRNSNIVKELVKKVLGLYYKLTAKDNTKYYKAYDKLVTSYNEQNTKCMSKVFFGPIEKKRIWKKSWFDDTVMMKFEMLELPVPSGYEELLDTFFGNWRVPKKVTTTHGGVLFDTKTPYKDYK